MKLHLISFDLPHPPDYGGVIDVYNKIRVLNKLGCKVILHAFHKNSPVPESIAHLKDICQEIYLYQRDTSLKNLIGNIPYIVKSRSDFRLPDNLRKDDAPILFEGLHSCYFLKHPALRDRKKIVRMHNIEWKYYRALADGEKNIFKKLFFKYEAAKLAAYETTVQLADHIVSISPKDKDYLDKILPDSEISFLPPFHFTDDYVFKSPRGNYVLFQGDLSIADTEDVLVKMIDRVFSAIDIPVIIAGKNPRKKLLNATISRKNIQLIPNPGGVEMRQLVENAHIILVYSGINAGMKLKLINGLFLGRFIIGDDNSIKGTGTEKICRIENNYDDLVNFIQHHWEMDFNEEMNEKRSIHLNENFSNIANGKKLQQLLE